MTIRLERLEHAALLMTGLLLAAGLAAAGAFFVFLAALASAIRGRRLSWQRTPLDLPILLLALAFGLSALLSDFPAMAAGSTALLAFGVYLGYGAVARAVTHDHAFLTRLVQAIAAGTVAAAIWGIVHYAVTGTPAQTGDGYNTLGTTLALGLPLLLGLTVPRRGWRLLFFSAGAAVAAVGLVLTFARGAWIGGLAGLVVFVACAPRTATARRLLPTVLLVTLVTGGIGLMGAAPALEQRAESTFDLTANRDRIAMWKAALEIFRDHPLFGTGLGTFTLIYPRYRLPADSDPVPSRPFAHNIFLTMAAEGGLLGVLSFAGLTAAALWWGLRWIRQAPQDERVITASVVAALVAVLVHQQVDETVARFHIGLGMWMLLGIISAGAGRLRRGRRERQAV